MKKKSGREVRITLRLTRAEFDEIQKNKLEYENFLGKKLKTSQYLRQIIFNSGKFDFAREQNFRELTFQIKKIGVNINQVVRDYNSGFFSRDQISSLENKLSEIYELLDKSKELKK